MRYVHCIIAHFGTYEEREKEDSKHDVQRLGYVKCFNDFFFIVIYCLITGSSVQMLPDITNKVGKQFLFSCFAVKGNTFVHFFPIKLKFSILCLPSFAGFVCF